MRGRADCDAWGTIAGSVLWSWERTLPHFVQAERNQKFNNRFHGCTGTLRLSAPSFVCDPSHIYVQITPDFNQGGLLSQAVMPGMKQRSGGAIINIISITLFGEWPDKVPYVMSKGALLGLTRTLARGWPARHSCQRREPAAIQTELEQKFWGNDRAAFDHWIIEKQPLKFRGSAEDIARRHCSLPPRAAALSPGASCM
jgi:NAD(P)-dependent dehydrogenase (short-subunit alcohol dehydrogenase family)